MNCGEKVYYFPTFKEILQLSEYIGNYKIKSSSLPNTLFILESRIITFISLNYTTLVYLLE